MKDSSDGRLLSIINDALDQKIKNIIVSMTEECWSFYLYVLHVGQ
jgi:hypothetical protein